MPEEEYKIIFKQPFRTQRVIIEEVTSSRLIDPDLEQLCKKKWSVMLLDAEKQGKQLWDSDIYRFESAIVSGHSITIRISTIPFAIRLAMNSYTGLVKKLGMNYAPLGMFSSCFIKTSDGMYVLIEKSNKYFTNKKTSFVGSVLSKTEKTLATSNDLFGEVCKEVEEEIGLDSSHIKECTLRCGYITDNYNCCLLFEVSLHTDFQEIERQFKVKNDGEASKLIGVEKTALGSFAQTIERKDAVKFEILNLI